MAPLINPLAWYRLSVDSLPGVSLDIINDGTAHIDGKLQMAPDGHYTGQHWQFLPSSHDTYCLRTSYTGTDMLLCCEGDNPHLSRETHIGDLPYRWIIEPATVPTDTDMAFIIRVALPGYAGAGHSGHYLVPEYDRGWDRGQRLRARQLEANTAPVWRLTEIEGGPNLTEYKMLPILLPGHGNWTNVRTRDASSGGHVSMQSDRPAAVEDRIRRLRSRNAPLGWSYRLDANGQLLYLDVHSLVWNRCATHEEARSPATDHLLDFSVLGGSNSEVELLPRIEALLHDLRTANTVVLDMTHACTDPKLLDIEANSEREQEQRDRPRRNVPISNQSQLYRTSSDLTVHRVGDPGLDYILIIRAGVHLLKVGTVSAAENYGEARWVCRIAGDHVSFLVQSHCLHAAG